MKLRTSALVALPLTVLLTAACGGSSPSQKKADDPGGATTAPRSTTAPTSGAPSGGKAGKPARAGSSATTGAKTPATTAASGAPGAKQPAAASAATFTAPGSYTYDAKGTATVSGSANDTSGSQTLKVDKPAGDRQHSSLGGDQGGGTQQDVVHRDNGTYLARLLISTAGFNKEFHPAQPVLGVPKPAAAGRSWSWSMTSTDGKTKADYSGTFVRPETVTIGGTKVATWVIESTLKISGDLDYTAHDTNNYDPSRLLEVRQHSRASGVYSGFAFSSDTTSTLRSLRPS